MQPKEIKAILDRYQNGESTAEERLQVELWYHQEASAGDWELNATQQEVVRQRLLNKLNAQIDGLEVPDAGKVLNGAKQRRLWPYITQTSAIWKVAAAIAVITIGIWLYNISNTSRHPELGSGSPLANDIAPGRNTAIITFDDGEAVALNDKELDISSESGPRRGGPKVSSEAPQFLASRIASSKTIVLSTPRGGMYQVVLPDGTRVWLNADSKLEFPSNFENNKQRIVKLSGEGYFEVANNKSKPFIVESREQQVEVLGTHFNISAYGDENATKTTLLEGSVRVAMSPLFKEGVPEGGGGKTEGTSTVLKPGQQSVITGSNRIEVSDVDVSESISWKEGVFLFNNEPLESIMRKLARWYDVEVVYSGADRQKLFAGGVSRYDHISKILSKMEKIGGVHFKIEGRKIIVTK